MDSFYNYLLIYSFSIFVTFNNLSIILKVTPQLNYYYYIMLTSAIQHILFGIIFVTISLNNILEKAESRLVYFLFLPFTFSLIKLKHFNFHQGEIQIKKSTIEC